MISGIKKHFSIFNRKVHHRNIILTGVPRSGSTLACKLLCELPNVIGLNEPLDPALFPDRKTAIKSIDQSFIKFRKSLLKEGKAPVRSKDGAITDNAYSEQKSGEKRKKVLKRTEVFFDKPLDRDFTLVMKHCAEFTLLFPELTKNYSCFANIRNPLALLGSWNSVNVPVSRGRVAKSRKILPSFHANIESIEALHDKQLFILSWYFGQFDLLPKDHILRYEDLIGSNGQLLKKITAAEVKFENDLQSRNHSKLYDHDQIIQLAEKLLKSEGNYWKYYSKADVEKLLNQYTGGQ